ncbi:kinesin-domain-containing protein [Anaeromyces robustus]|uniref:Kinesin-like protein n=1 Tax=Anaeromyces robustus TaxID=1754192 RepID=A0A1Y1XL24_9FUNG|nr:kinesin-domain-containing protein [Anaeromyces robustus]|eukprot:ORX86405.1 kinesin-domain-containing protein [Anaeromyces robustus]
MLKNLQSDISIITLNNDDNTDKKNDFSNDSSDDKNLKNNTKIDEIDSDDNVEEISTIKIYSRIRPSKYKVPNRYWIVKPEEDVLNDEKPLPKIGFLIPRSESQGLINNQKEKHEFKFDRVFDKDTKQEEIFDVVAKDVVLSVLDGYNGTIFAYGQTGSGKTFTITGGAERYEDRGIIPRSLQFIFKEIQKRTDCEYSINISYLEIYNENGYDLLDSSREAKKLEDLPKVYLMEDDENRIHIRNLASIPAVNEEEALNLLFIGDTNRVISETPSNPESSRSHCIFIITVVCKRQGHDAIRKSKLHLVDLAGSERVAKTQIGGTLLKEAKYINLSLHYLEQVIIALHEKALGKRQHIPYRNSMMTSVLRDSLGGNCKTTMIATIAVEPELIEVIIKN